MYRLIRTQLMWTTPVISVRLHGQWMSTSAAVSESKSQPRPISEMPGFKSVPVFGSFFSIITRKDFDLKRIHVFWENLSREFGPVYRLHMPFIPKFVIITNPDDVAKLLRITIDNPVRQGFHSLQKVRQEAIDSYFENKLGILIENNEEWWRIRSRVQTPLMRPKNVVKYLPKMDEVALTFMDRIAVFQTQYGEMPENFLEELYKWSIESVGLVALNRRLGCLDPDISPDTEPMQMIHAANVMLESMNETEMHLPIWKLIPTTAYKNLRDAHAVFLRIADANIVETQKALQAKLESSNEEDRELTLMEILLRTEGLSRKDVTTLILDMLFAGIDTTAHTLAFTLYCLARNHEAQKRVQDEVDSVLGDGKGTLTEGHLARLSYTKACVKEAQRLFPVVLGVLRTLQEDAEFGGYLVPKGYQVAALNIICAKDEALFPQANKYLPERWGRDQPLGPIHPFAFNPFSYGPRMCIGRRIAEQEIYTFLTRVMHRYNIDYKHKDIEVVSRLVGMPSQPLRFEFKERR